MKPTCMILLALVLSILLAACAAPSANADGSVNPQPRVAAVPTMPPPSAPPMSTPLPPREAPQQAGSVDYGCKNSADCAVKNVGNCCGAQPACVNKDSPTDPAAVQAQCQARGMMGVCGFQEISACQCVSGRCAADTSADARQAQ